MLLDYMLTVHLWCNISMVAHLYYVYSIDVLNDTPFAQVCVELHFYKVYLDGVANETGWKTMTNIIVRRCVKI